MLFKLSSAGRQAPTDGRAPATQTFVNFDAQLNAVLPPWLAATLARPMLATRNQHHRVLFRIMFVHGVAACPATPKHCDCGVQSALCGH